MLKKKKEFGKFSRKKENQIKFFLSTWARRFNIFITLTDYCGGYPRATERGHFSFESFGGNRYIFLSAFRNIAYLCHVIGVRSVH